jgi:hypothetical protein
MLNPLLQGILPLHKHEAWRGNLNQILGKSGCHKMKKSGFDNHSQYTIINL